jgi:hypothetical protein
VRENEDIFLDEVGSGVRLGSKSNKRDVHLYRFSCGRLGVKSDLKENPNFTKNLLKLAI